MAINTRSRRLPYNSPLKPRAAGRDPSVNPFGSMRTELSQKQGRCPSRRSKRAESGKAVALSSNEATHIESPTKLSITKKDFAANANRRRSSRVRRSDLLKQYKLYCSMFNEKWDQDAIETMDKWEVLDDVARERSSKVDKNHERVGAVAKARRASRMDHLESKGFPKLGLCQWEIIHRLDDIFRISESIRKGRTL